MNFGSERSPMASGGSATNPNAAPDPNPLGQAPIESMMAVRTVRRAIWVGPVLVALLWIFRGNLGASSAVLGVLVVAGNFLLAGAILSTAARISLTAYHAAALFGFFLRLALITATMLVIVRFVDLDRLSFGLAAVGSYMVLLILEAVAVARGRERDLDWTS